MYLRQGNQHCTHTPEVCLLVRLYYFKRLRSKNTAHAPKVLPWRLLVRLLGATHTPRGRLEEAGLLVVVNLAERLRRPGDRVQELQVPVRLEPPAPAGALQPTAISQIQKSHSPSLYVRPSVLLCDDPVAHTSQDTVPANYGSYICGAQSEPA